MKVLIVGANGQLGRCLQDVLPKGSYVLATRETLDMSKPEKVSLSLNLLCKNHSFTHLINCAAYTDVQKAEGEIEEAYRVNCHSVRELAKWCKKQDIKLVHISTDYAAESPAPRNIYGQSKLAGEQAVQAVEGKFAIIRTSALFSEYARTSFLTKILEQAKTRKTLTITEYSYCQPTYAQDLASYIAMAVLQHEGTLWNGKHIINFCNPVSIPFYNFASLIKKYAELNVYVESTGSMMTKDDPIRPSYPHLEGAVAPNFEYSLRHCIQRMKDLGKIK